MQRVFNFLIFALTKWGRFNIVFWALNRYSKFGLLKSYLGSKATVKTSNIWFYYYCRYRYEVLFGSYEVAAKLREEMNRQSFKNEFLDRFFYNQKFKLDFESGNISGRKVTDALITQPFVEGFFLNRYSLSTCRDLMLKRNWLPDKSRFVIIGSAPSVENEFIRSVNTYFVVLNPRSDHQIIERLSPVKLVAAFNGEAFVRALSSEKELEFLKSLALVLVRSSRDFKLASKFGLLNAAVMTDARTLMMHDYGFNAIQNVVASLIPMQPKEILITGASLFLGENLARRDYQPKDFNPMRRFFGLRYHDPIANFIFLNVLLNKGVIEVDEVLGSVLREGVLVYGTTLDAQWGRYNLLDKENIC